MSTLPPDSPKPAAGTDHDALPPGTRFGEFEILRVLGVGGFGIVYLANDHSLEREVALKEYMPASLAARGQGPQITVRSSSFAETYAIGLRSFVNEARLLARFDHPSLVKVYRFWEDNATAYMVMPFLQGVTLRDTRRAMPHPPDEAWIRSVITPILSALELLHREGVYHRDIAPDNILLPPDGPPVLLDFGAARRVISDRTQSLTAILKPSYAPIEQYAEMVQMRQGPWTDLYALGAVIHYLLFGAPPAPATARAVQDDTEAIEHRIVPGVSPGFLEVVSWMLSVRPNQRPQNGEQLRAVLDGHAVIPPRGRPGITIPGAPAAAAVVAPFESTQHVDHGPNPTNVKTAYMPTHLPTAQMPAPGQPRPTSFSPTAQMPTARVPTSQFDASPIMTQPPQRPAPAPRGATTTIPPQGPHTLPPQPGQPPVWPPSQAPEWQASRPATLPPPLPGQAAPPTLPPRSQPAPFAVQAAHPTAPMAVAAPAASSSSKAWVAIAGGVVVLALAGVGGWQFMAKRDAAASDSANAAASAAGATSAAAAPPPATAVPVAAIPATTVPATTEATTTTTPANVTAVPATSSTASTLPDETKPTPPPQARVVPATTPATVARPLPGDRPNLGDRVAERPALATPAPAANVARVHPTGTPVPNLRGNDGSTAPNTNMSSRVPESPAVNNNAYNTPANANNYPANTNSYPANTGADRPRPLGQSNVRDPVVVQRPVPPPVVETGPATAREACGKRVFIALFSCMEEKCQEPRFRSSAECASVLARKAQRDNR
ncbi:MAG: protein kinase [Caldimonas sp.]